MLIDIRSNERGLYVLFPLFINQPSSLPSLKKHTHTPFKPRRIAPFNWLFYETLHYPDNEPMVGYGINTFFCHRPARLSSRFFIICCIEQKQTQCNNSCCLRTGVFTLKGI